MSGLFGLKINKEAFQERANADISEIERVFLENSLNSFHLTSYLKARAEKEFFAGVLNSYRNPSIDFVDFVEYYTQPSPADPLNRSTSPMSNLMDDMEQHLKGQVYSHILRLREVQAERKLKESEGK
jgi:hypothetical protein